MSARRRRATVPAVPPEQPTPERLAHAGGAYTTGDDGTIRIFEAPLERLRDRCALDADAKTNRILFQAGDQLRTDWHKAGLTGCGAVDYNRIGGGTGDPAYAMPATEYAAAARWRVRNAFRSLDPREAAVVGAVVIDEMPLEQAGRYLGRKAHVPLARDRSIKLAVACVRSGLTALAKQYGMMR